MLLEPVTRSSMQEAALAGFGEILTLGCASLGEFSIQFSAKRHRNRFANSTLLHFYNQIVMILRGDLLYQDNKNLWTVYVINFSTKIRCKWRRDIYSRNLTINKMINFSKVGMNRKRVDKLVFICLICYVFNNGKS